MLVKKKQSEMYHKMAPHALESDSFSQHWWLFLQFTKTQNDDNVLQKDFRLKWKVLNTASYELQTAVRQNMSDDRLS